MTLFNSSKTFKAGKKRLWYFIAFAYRKSSLNRCYMSERIYDDGNGMDENMLNRAQSYFNDKAKKLTEGDCTEAIITFFHELNS